MGIWQTVGNVAQGIGSGLPIIGGLIQGNINAKVARENTDKTIAANKELARYQYQKDLEMWNLGNKYNDPSSQMQRLKAAGLNPNMVYGSGSAAGMSAGQLPKYNAPTVDYNYVPPVDIPSMISAFQDFRLKQAEYTKRDLTGDLLGIKKAGEEKLVGVEGSKGNIDIMPAWAARASGQNTLLQAKAQDARVLSKYSWEKRREEARQVELKNQQIVEQTRNLDLQNEYFAAKAITGLFGGALGAVGKLGAMIKGGRGAKGALSADTLKGAASTTQKGPRYNSPTFWKQFDHLR